MLIHEPQCRISPLTATLVRFTEAHQEAISHCQAVALTPGHRVPSGSRATKFCIANLILLSQWNWCAQSLFLDFIHTIRISSVLSENFITIYFLLVKLGRFLEVNFTFFCMSAHFWIIKKKKNFFFF